MSFIYDILFLLTITIFMNPNSRNFSKTNIEYNIYGKSCEIASYYSLLGSLA